MKTRFLFSALALALAACGGGGGGGGTTPTPTPQPPSQTLGDLQGFWSGAVSGASLLSAATAQGVTLSDGSDWVILLSAAPNAVPVGLVKAALAVSGTGYTGTGSVFSQTDGSSVGTVTLAGQAVAATSKSAALTLSGATTNLALSYSAAYATPAALLDAQGNWQISGSAGAIEVTLTVAANGAITGTSTTGCAWTGTVAPRTGVGVFDLVLHEVCVPAPPAAAITNDYTGVEVLNAAKTRATLLVTTTGNAKGFVLTALKL